MSDCPSNEELSRWLDAGPAGDSDPGLAEHVEACPRCQGVLERLTALGDGDAPAPTLVTPAGELGRLRCLLQADAAAGDEAAADWPTLPGYEFLGELGRGGMGVVYKARQASPNRPVAIKMLRDYAGATPEEVVRFGVEAETVAKLQHANIVQIYEVGVSRQRPYFALEYLAGGNLDDRLAGRPLPPQQAAALVEAVARAIQHAHERGIVHRDLKPANVLLTADGTPKVADFGMARLLHADLRLTRTGMVAGTPAYMAPEQARPGKAGVGPAADVYALGTILYETLTGRPPFVGDSALDVLRQAADCEPVTPSRLVPKVPRDLENVCLKCLQKEPRRRYATAQALAEDLARFREGRPVQARPISPVDRAWRWCRRNPGTAALLAALALVFATGFGTSLWQMRVAQANAAAEGAAREEAQANLYAARMSLVQSAWQDARLRRVFDLLELCRPARPGDRDLRGWEWRHQWRLCHDDLRTFEGHTDWVLGVAISPDGARLATAGHDHTARLWDVASGRSLRVFRGHADEVSSAVFSPDGSLLATASTDRTVKLWDVATGNVRHTLIGHTLKVKYVAFSPDGRLLASTSWDQTVRLWDVATGRERHVLHGHTARVRGVAFSPDGRLLASGGSDHVVRLWDVAGAREVRCLRGHAEDVEGVAFSPDGRWLASTSWDRTVKIWDLKTGRERHTLRGHTSWVYDAAFSPDGRRLATAGWDETVRVWDPVSGRLVRVLRGHAHRVHRLAYSPDGLFLATASADRTARLWAADGGEEFRAFPGLAAQVEALAYSPDGRRLASATGSEVKVWDADVGVVSSVLRGDSPVKGVAFSPDGTSLAAADSDGTVRLWDVAGGRPFRALHGHRGSVKAVAFRPDGGRLATGGEDRAVKLWDPLNGREVAALQGHSGAIVGVVFSPNGRWLASGAQGADGHGEIRFWDADDGRALRTFRLEDSDEVLLALAVSPDGRWLATASGVWEERGTIRLWDTTEGRVVRTLRGHNHWVTALAFNPDGTRLASAGHDHVVKLWDPATGQELRSLQGLRRFFCVAFSPDGTRLATGSQDSAITYELTLRIWDARPPTDAGRAEHEAQAVLDDLFARPLCRADVREYLRALVSISPAAREKALALAERYAEETDPESFYRACWAVLCLPHLHEVQYRFALLQAEAACRLRPGQASYQTALGAAQYRTAQYEKARATLSKAGPLTPAGLAFLAMAQQRLGLPGQARVTRARLRDDFARHEGELGEETVALRDEAESLIANTAAKLRP